MVASSQLLSEVMIQKFISIWRRGNGLSCSSGVLAASGDFVLSGRLPGPERGHTWQLPHVRTWPAGQKCDTSQTTQLNYREPVAHSHRLSVSFKKATDEQLPSERFNHCSAPLFVIYSGCCSAAVTPATRVHRWRGHVQGRSMLHGISPLVTLWSTAVKRTTIILVLSSSSSTLSEIPDSPSLRWHNKHQDTLTS